MTSLRTPFVLFLVVTAFAAGPEERKGKGGKGAETPKGAIDLVAAAKPANNPFPAFTLTSPVVKDGGTLPVEFTGDGGGVSPPLAWSNLPKGTASLALVMHHLDPEGNTKVYWLVTGINPQTSQAAKDAKDFGQLGVSTVHDRVEYAPPHSKGPGLKKYVLPLFALSAKPSFADPAKPVTIETLLPAIKGKVLGAADLTVTYTRAPGGANEEAKGPPRKGPPAGKGE